MPAIPLWLMNEVDAGFGFIAGNTSLYLGIAEHSTAEFFSLDGEKPTNGFHPLWQRYLWLMSQLIGGKDNELVKISALSGIFLCGISVILVGMAVAKITK